MSTKFKLLAVITILLNLAYLFWLPFNVNGVLGVWFFFAETLMFSLLILEVINHWEQDHRIKHTHLVAKGSVDIFVPVVNEPLGMYETTLKAVVNIDYEDKKVFILDDGNRSEIEALAKKYNVTYLKRTERLHNKAGNLNHGLEHSTGDYVLVMDADQVPKADIIQDLLGYFQDDERIAIVSTRQSFDVDYHDFNHDEMFYHHMQTGKNADNSAISCGSGVFYRRSALDKIGGFQTWNIVEDLYTSYILHANGFTSVYINERYSKGTAPTDLKNIYKQRGTWALDTLRIFFKKSPLFYPGLTLRQRLHYFEMGWIYIVSALATPMLFTLPPVSLVLDIHVVNDPYMYLFLRLPSMVLVIYIYYLFNGKRFSEGQFWTSLFPIYLKAFVLAIFSASTKYVVTQKVRQKSAVDLLRVWPHLLLVGLSIFAIIWRLAFWKNNNFLFFIINLLWISLMYFRFYPVIRKAFNRA